MLEALLVLLGFQLLGELVTQLVQWPVPGPVVGMLLLFVMLTLRGGDSGGLASVSNTLLRHLSLLFVPAGVGVIRHADLVARHWLALTVTLVASAAITLVATAAAMQGCRRLLEGRRS